MGHCSVLNTEADMRIQMLFLLAGHCRHLQKYKTVPLSLCVLILVLKSILHIFHNYI